MGLLKKYNERITLNDNSGIVRNPSLPNQLTKPATDQFNETSLDLENPQPLGGPINVAYTTKVGSEVKTSPTTQPYTPKSTYSDSFTNPELISRTIDPIK